MDKKRMTTLGLVFLGLLTLIAAQVARWSLIEGGELAAAAHAQRQLTADYYQYARGDIVDRQGRALVNAEQRVLLAWGEWLPGQEDTAAAALAPIIGCTEEALCARFQQAASGQTTVIWNGLSDEQARKISDLKQPGIVALPLAVRYSPGLAAQLIGGLQMDADGHWRGASGLELAYDELLTDREDKRLLVAVDAAGRMSGPVRCEDAKTVRTSTLQLTLDRDIQQLAEEALAASGLHGACVVMEAASGDLLALASAPTFDSCAWQEPPDSAYLQRCLLLYPPASTFKQVLAAASLEQGVQPESGLDASGCFVCTGVYELPDGRQVHCADGQAHGSVDLASALAVSCNCYFTALGQALGAQTVRDYAERLGLTEQRLLGYEAGLPDYNKEDFLHFQDGLSGELANVCLGEAGISVSPLQMAAMTACFVNGGFRVTPRLVTSVTDRDGRQTDLAGVAPVPVLPPETAEALRLLLMQVVEQGTGRGAQGDVVRVGGKTGSSETGAVWFCGFFPAAEPRWVAAVCLEQGSAGGAEAAAVFKRLADRISLLDGRV